MPLVLIGIGVLAIMWFSLGSALTSSQQSQAHTQWYSWLAGAVVAIPVELTKASIQLAKYLAHFMYPGLQYAETRVAQYFAGLGQQQKWTADHVYRQSLALGQFSAFVTTVFHRQILKEAEHTADIANAKNALTKAPPLPQRRITQHEADIRFQQLIGENFTSELKDKDPKFDWGKFKWIAFLGLGDLHQGAVVVAPRTPVKPQAPMKVQPLPKPSPIAPAQPTTLPHTDDKPTPDPGVQVVPGVVPGKDKWARGQIVRLKQFEISTRKHLGPLAFLAIPAAGITTLIGLLECKNFGRFARGICAIPTNLFNDLLGLLLDTLILGDICDVITLVQDAFGVVEGPLADFIGGVGGALCHGDYEEQAWGGLLYSTPAPELNTLAL